MTEFRKTKTVKRLNARGREQMQFWGMFDLENSSWFPADRLHELVWDDPAMTEIVEVDVDADASPPPQKKGRRR